MTKKPTEEMRGLTQVGVRLPPPAIDEIDEIVEERNAKAGWKESSRSDVVREMVMKGLEDHRAARSKKTKPHG